RAIWVLRVHHMNQAATATDATAVRAVSPARSQDTAARQVPGTNGTAERHINSSSYRQNVFPGISPTGGVRIEPREPPFPAYPVSLRLRHKHRTSGPSGSRCLACGLVIVIVDSPAGKCVEHHLPGLAVLRAG